MTLLLAILTEEIVHKAPIIAMIMGDADAMLGGEALECVLRLEGLVGREVACHEVDKLKLRKMINKNGGIAVACLGESPLCLPIKTWLRGLHVVDGDTLPWLGGGKNGVSVLTLLFALPRYLCHGSVEAASALRRMNVGELL